MSKEFKSKRFEGVYYRELSNGDRSYFLRFRLDGKIKRIPIGRKSEGITEAFCNQERIRIINANRFGEDAAKQLQKVKKEDPSFKELIDFYLSTSAIKETTKRGVKVLYKTPFADNRRVLREDIQNYLDELTTRVRPATVALRSRQIKQVIRYAIKRGKYQYADPTINLDLPKGTGGRKRFLSPQEIQTLLEAVKDQPHLYLFVKMSICTGARLNTLLTVHSDDIKPDGSVKLINHKADRVYKGYFDEETMSLLRNKKGYVLAEKGKEKNPPPIWYIQRPLLDIMDSLFNTFSTPTDERVVIHTLRHSIGAQMVRKGVPLEIISKTLDHSNTAVTAQFYAHVPEDIVKKATTGLWD